MSESTPQPDRFIVDNSDDDWKVLRYLREWCGLSVEMFLSVWPRPQQPTHRDQLSQVIRVVVCNVHYGTEDPSTIGFV